MKKVLFILSFGIFVISCKEQVKVKSATTTNEPSTAANLNLPYVPNYPIDWNNNVSDGDLKMVLNTYKDWQDNNMESLGKAMGDTVTYDMASGVTRKLSNADLMKLWKTSRDSLSSVDIKMQTWNKMYSPSKNQTYVVTWYDEKDTYKDGRIDYATYHDINNIKDGKIVWYAQYKRPLKLPK